MSSGNERLILDGHLVLAAEVHRDHAIDSLLSSSAACRNSAAASFAQLHSYCAGKESMMFACDHDKFGCQEVSVVPSQMVSMSVLLLTIVAWVNLLPLHCCMLYKLEVARDAGRGLWNRYKIQVCRFVAVKFPFDPQVLELQSSRPHAIIESPHNPQWPPASWACPDTLSQAPQLH